MTTVDDRCRLVFRRFRIYRFFRRPLYEELLRKKDGVNFFNFPKKCLGPGASEKPFGPSRGGRDGILGAPGRFGGHLGVVLGGLGAILERLFEQSDFGSIV